MISEPALEVYRRFSPGVVRDMNTDPELRRAILIYAVHPTFHLLQMAETYLRAEADDEALLAALDQSVEAYVADLSGAGVRPEQAETASARATAAALVLAPCAGGGPRETPARRNEAAPADDVHGYLAAAIATRGSELAAYAWAFEGMALLLGQASAKAGHGDRITDAFASAFGAWVARLPIPPGALLSVAEAREELQMLAERVFTRSVSRAAFARHLLARWPAASAPALRSLLGDLHYLRPRPDTTE